MDLPPQAVEIVGGRGAVDDLPVRLLDLRTLVVPHGGDVVGILLNHLEVSLHAAGGVLKFWVTIEQAVVR